jgi:conjugal transfer pilus assembly protein TraA
MKFAKRIPTYLPLAVFGLFIIASNVYAGTGGTEFQQLYDMLTAWTNGVLGKTIALACFLVGMGFSIVQQSLIPVAVGIGAAAALAYTPSIVDTVITATLF